MKIEDEILELYYGNHSKQKDIADKLNISKYKVSRTVSKDSRYCDEKKYRQEISKQNHRNKTVNYIKKQRKQAKNDFVYESLKRQHLQASSELSGGKKSISNKVFRDWNSSIYQYDSNSKTYNLKREIVTGYDVPKKIKW